VCIANSAIVRGGGSWRKVRVQAGKEVSDVELGAFFSFRLGNKMAGRLLCTP